MTENILSDKSFIKVYDNLIRPEDCDAAIEFFEKEKKFKKTFTRADFEQSSITSKADTAAQVDYDNFEEAVLSENGTLKTLFINLNQAFQIYLKETDILEHLGTPELHWDPQKIQKTLPGQGYHLWHTEKSGPYLDMLKRMLVHTLYLNDVEEGGETEFLIQNMRVKPKKGRVCFFPAHFPYIHRGNPPLSGEKYIMTSWFSIGKFD